jgi:hypothetical protein
VPLRPPAAVSLVALVEKVQLDLGVVGVVVEGADLEEGRGRGGVALDGQRLAMEAVKTLDCSRQELLGVEGTERSEGDDGNCGGPRWPDGCGYVGASRLITREGKWAAASRESEAAIVPIEPDGQHNRR